MTVKKLYLLLLLCFCLATSFAQVRLNSYDQSWKTIDSLILVTGQIKTALTAVQGIYTKAKRENNDVQVIKALTYRTGLENQVSDQTDHVTFETLEKEIATARQPAKSILQSLLANAYWNYFQNNRYRFYNRTATSGYKKADPATWAPAELHEQVATLFLQSISNTSLLQSVKLEPYDPIIIKGNSRNLRPTLYDLLAHRALDYFKNDERNIARPAYAFEINEDQAFAEAATFAAHIFKTSDSTSLHYQALQLFRQLISMHLSDKQPDALIDIDIERIQFAIDNSVAGNKEQQYQQALEHIIATYNGNQYATQATYLLAQSYASKASTYDPLKDTTYRYAYLKAKALCESVMSQRVNSEGKVNCTNLLQEITTKEIKTDAEQVNVPGRPFRMLLTYKNIGTAYFRIVKLEDPSKDRMQRDMYNERYWQQMVNLPALSTLSYDLPQTKDFQRHRVEIKIDALTPGEYAIIASASNDFNLKHNTLAVQYVYISGISHVNSGNKYYVVDRTTGAPLSGAGVQIWREKYDYQQRKNILTRGKKYTTDKNGYFNLTDTSPAVNNYNHLLDITYAKDRLFANEQVYSYTFSTSNIRDSEKRRTFLFSDRSIYRPGQLMYFKGLVVGTDNVAKKPAVISAVRSNLRLYDANNQVIDSIEVTSNDFGSYSGKFTLPSGALNGEFYIKDEKNNGELRFSVEEYKRPKFAVEIKKPEGTYRLQDTIRVEGSAKAFAGNNVDGASVTYRVVRKMNIPFPAFGHYTKIWPPYPSNTMEIAHGETTTDADGKFVISFKAVPDNTVPSSQDPVFNFEVTADVTDINGETRSGNTYVPASEKALQIALDIPSIMRADSLKTLKVSTTNTNGAFEKTPISVVIQKLAAPSRVLRERYWEQPDQFVFNHEEYSRLFPDDIYSDEQDPTKWSTEKIILHASAVTTPDTPVSIESLNADAGWYSIVITAKDRFNNSVSATSFVHLYDKRIVSPIPLLQLDNNTTSAQPGDQIAYTTLTNLANARVIREIIRPSGEKRDLVMIGNTVASEVISVGEADRGEIVLNTIFVQNNRVYSAQRVIAVPYLNKQLKIEYTTFRDKVVPGSSEKWKVKISGFQGDKVAAELLTTMYDASLDQFTPHAWTVPSLWYSGMERHDWTGVTNFAKKESFNNQVGPRANPGVEKTYDDLVEIGDGHIYRMLGYSKAVRGLITARSEAVVAKAPAQDQAAKEKEQAADTAGFSSIQPRTNLNETAFFIPDLHTDSSGNVEFTFTSPGALTTWKWMLLAHTKELAFGYGEKTIITQKELMVQPNAPRFLRAGDQVNFSAKIVNLTTKKLAGKVVLQLTDALTGKNVDHAFGNANTGQSFIAPASQSTAVSFSISIPEHFNSPLTWRIIATSGTLSDGEEAIVPVVTNRMVVTESLPLTINGTGTKKYTFDKLLQSGGSTSLEQKGITVEFSTNPAWYAVQALPYLSGGEKDNAEQLFNVYYANALAMKISGSSPRLKAVFQSWLDKDTAILLSNLMKNEELKSVLLKETPWVLEAKTETEQKRNIAVLFDLSRMSAERTAALNKLKAMQSPNGGFVWLNGGPEDRYMTQYILSGIGHLKQLGSLPKDSGMENLIQSAITYLDNELVKDYARLPKEKNTTGQTIDHISAQYLYMRSFFPDIDVPGNVFTAYNFYRNQSKASWVKQNTYTRAMIALALFRTGDVQTARNIMRALSESTVSNQETGMYWKDMVSGYYWYQAPVETQSLAIEAFAEIMKDNKTINGLKTWLLKNKQTSNWKTSRATADACYALLLQGGDWISQDPAVKITLGDTTISAPGKTEAGTGYFKQYIGASEVKPSLGNIVVQFSSASKELVPAWGSVYWQYMEDLDKISPASTPLHLARKLFIEKNTDRGPVLEALNNSNTVHTGDKIKVRIELSVDRAMEYVHMKDMRASCMEPVNVLSEYKWQDGLGYYETTRDASTDFFFQVLPKGVYVFEYALFVSASGTFSNGVTSIQCMYAPEFISHSEGIKVKSENK